MHNRNGINLKAEDFLKGLTRDLLIADVYLDSIAQKSLPNKSLLFNITTLIYELGQQEEAAHEPLLLDRKSFGVTLELALSQPQDFSRRHGAEQMLRSFYPAAQGQLGSSEHAKMEIEIVFGGKTKYYEVELAKMKGRGILIRNPREMAPVHKFDLFNMLLPGILAA